MTVKMTAEMTVEMELLRIFGEREKPFAEQDCYPTE